MPGTWSARGKIHHRLLPLMQVLFVEANPIPVKFALAMMGMIPLSYRLPLVPPAAETQSKIQKVLEGLQLLPGTVPAGEGAYVAGGAN